MVVDLRPIALLLRHVCVPAGSHGGESQQLHVRVRNQLSSPRLCEDQLTAFAVGPLVVQQDQVVVGQ